ncbi:MAG: hypothetical protein ACR2PL_25800 [Dehalococcoidia bacterium]
MNHYLPDSLILLNYAFKSAHIPHAFDGAIALAYWGIPRATRDIGVNVFLSVEHRAWVLDAVSELFPVANREQVEQQIARSAQVRLRWQDTPVDLFFSNSELHDAMADRARSVVYAGTEIHVLSAEDLILCKAAFDRAKDWVDIEDVCKIQGKRLDQRYLRRWLSEFYEPSDQQCQRIEGLLRRYVLPPGPETHG